MYIQGNYTPKNKDKYKGKYPITYRSSWELKLFMFLDNTSNVISWGSESAVVQYVDITRKNTIHNYLIDITAIIKNNTGNFTKYYIEVKPFKETKQPEKNNKKEHIYIKEVLTYQRNLCKWKAAAKFAKQKGNSFIILTEKDLFK